MKVIRSLNQLVTQEDPGHSNKIQPQADIGIFEDEIRFHCARLFRFGSPSPVR